MTGNFRRRCPINKRRRRSRWPVHPLALLIPVAVLSGIGCDYRPPEIGGLDADSAFVLAVIPVLQDQCEGCHFPGGPMHKKMPFDDMAVVGGLEDEVVSRLEGKGRERVAEWLEIWREEREAEETRAPGP